MCTHIVRVHTILTVLLFIGVYIVCFKSRIRWKVRYRVGWEMEGKLIIRCILRWDKIRYDYILELFTKPENCNGS